MRRDDEQSTVIGEPVGEASPTAAEAEQVEPAETVELSEADVLRQELEKAQAEAADFKNRFLRARADLENYRRRAAGDVQRARESGLDSAVLPLLAVYDDLGRALTVGGDDPARRR